MRLSDARRLTGLNLQGVDAGAVVEVVLVLFIIAIASEIKKAVLMHVTTIMVCRMVAVAVAVVVVTRIAEMAVVFQMVTVLCRRLM